MFFLVCASLIISPHAWPLRSILFPLAHSIDRKELYATLLWCRIASNSEAHQSPNVGKDLLRCIGITTRWGVRARRGVANWWRRERPEERLTRTYARRRNSTTVWGCKS